MRLHTEPGDSFVFGSEFAERNDLSLTQSATDCFEGQEHWWAHSILFPSDYRAPDPGGWGVAFDFHDSSNQCLPGEVCQANFHVLSTPTDTQALDGRLAFLGYGGLTTAPVSYWAGIGNIAKNEWYDFVYHVKWSSGSGGFFDAWVNGVKSLTYRGPTLYEGQGCYLKLANYHTAAGQPSSVIHDRVVRDTTADAVRDSATLLSTPSQGAYEEGVGTYTGPLRSWATYGSEVGTFSGGTIAASNVANSTSTFSFTGTALSWIGAKCNVCGLANVSIDGGTPTMVNTAGPAAVGSLTSEVVFSASGLAPGVDHTIVITVTGSHSTGSTDNYIVVDGFNVSM